MARDLRSMAFFGALALALLTGTYAASFVPKHQMPENRATESQTEIHPPLSLSWVPSWLMNAISSTIAEKTDKSGPVAE